MSQRSESNQSVYAHLLKVCEQLLIHSALPADLLEKYQAFKQKTLASHKHQETNDHSRLVELQAEISQQQDTIHALQDEKQQLHSKYQQLEERVARLKRDYEHQIIELRIEGQSRLDKLQARFDQMVIDARRKIELQERDLEASNVFSARVAEILLPHLERHQVEYEQQQRGTLLSEKDILLDFLRFLLTSKPQSGNKYLANSSHKKSEQGTAQKYIAESKYTATESKYAATESKYTASEQKYTETGSGSKHREPAAPSKIETEPKANNQGSNLDDIYHQLKEELKQSKQTLKEFELSRSFLQGAIQSVKTQ